MEWTELGLNPTLNKVIAAQNWSAPTPVQEAVIPTALAGHDLLGIAPTGTGKTGAYGLPLMHKLRYAQGKYPRAVVVAPTRELVVQIEAHVKALNTGQDLRIVAVYGGIGPKAQKDAVNAGCDLIIATPGRLLDLYRSGDIVFKELKTLVLDEADKMMDMGFMPQIRALLEVIPRKRQNMLFSATFPAKVEELSYEFLEHPVRHEVSPQSSTSVMIAQHAFLTPNEETKQGLLKYLIQDPELNRVIIFAKTKTKAEELAKLVSLWTDPEQVRAIHGNRGQNSRLHAFDRFKDGDLRFLIATDVAARGLDVSMVSHVINYEVPQVYEDYVHRIGRTGRASASGIAITFIHPGDEPHMGRIEEIIRMEVLRVPIPAEVEVYTTPFEELQGYRKSLDRLRQKADPTYQGAFHEKKNKHLIAAAEEARKKEQAKAQSKQEATDKPKPAKPGKKKSPKGQIRERVNNRTSVAPKTGAKISAFGDKKPGKS